MTEEQALYQQLRAKMPTLKRPDGLDYISGEQVITRLNEVLGFDRWSFLVKEHGIHAEADEVWVLGELIYGATPKAGADIVGDVAAPSYLILKHQQFGSQKLKRRRSDGAILDLGFDLKGAATDAMKKCATHIGVGLWMSEKAPREEREERDEPEPVRRPAVPKAPAVAPAGPGASAPASPAPTATAEMVTSVDDRLYQGYVALFHEATALGVDTRDLAVALPHDRALLVQKGKTLRERVDAKKEPAHAS